MHATLGELLENVKGGLFWVQQDGKIKYANSDASKRTGLTVDKRIYEVPLLNAIKAVVGGSPPIVVQVPGMPTDFGRAAPMLECRVLPGLSKDDAFIMIMPDPTTDKTVAYQNLMRVLHTDLGDPLKQALTELTKAKKASSGSYYDEMFDKFEDISDLLGRVHDLASLWGNHNLLSDDRVELWDLIKTSWNKLEPMATRKAVKVSFRSPISNDELPAVYGSPPWLTKVFEECLQSIIRSARDGSELMIEHRQVGPRAIVVFRLSGAFESQHPDAVKLPVTRDKNGNPIVRNTFPHARDFIGFELSRHIVALHGGTLREERDGGIKSFIIDMPTGAPARIEPSQLDIQQAQKYAEDLARLISARRNKP